MKLIVGLGNPGNNYSSTKHNFGFWIIDKLVEQRSLKYKAGKGEYIFAKDNQYIFVKPTTFVNNSGIAIKQILNYYDNIDVGDIIVVYDDIDINLGNIRFRSSGADGGHNGIKSIIYQLESDIFDRLKIGIATDMQMRPSEDYVLKPFSEKFNELVNEVIDNAVDGINYYLQHTIDETMNNYNKKDDCNGE
tara:strand:- start:77 stop:649 length:573 start_codon:yes stop_codon:yes gene_type:complete